MIRNLGRLALDRRTGRRINTLVRNVTLEMPPTLDAIAKISVTQRRIQLPYGYLAARWCSTYRTRGLLNGAIGFDAFRQAVPVGDTFTWPGDVPAPDQATEQVANVNKIFSYVLFATVLHEIGHIVHRERRVFGVRLELACDAFAMDYYIQSYRSENLKPVALGLAIWVCCLCSESLFFTEHKSRSHPNPARRMEQLFARHLSRLHGLAAMRLLCVAHLINLAKIRREDVFHEIHDREYSSFLARVHALRKCWGPRG